MLNKAVLMGRLTADPELRHTPNQVPVTSFTLAVNRTYSQSREQSVADFIDIVAWRSTAEFVCKYFKKGMQVAVSGSIQTRSWKDKEGNNRKSVEIVADEVFFAEGKRSDGGAPAPRTGGGPFVPDLPDASSGFPFSGENEFKELDDDDELPF